MSLDYIQRFWDALALEVNRLLGKFGAEALFSRLFNVSQAETTILKGRIRLPTLPCEPAHDLSSLQPPHQLTRASDALTHQFELLSRDLIGSALTSHLLLNAVRTANQNFEHCTNPRRED